LSVKSPAKGGSGISGFKAVAGGQKFLPPNPLPFCPLSATALENFRFKILNHNIPRSSAAVVVGGRRV